MSRFLSASTLLAFLVVLPACTDEPTSASNATPADAPATTGQPQADSSDTKAERAAAALLSADDVAGLDSTGVPVYVPVVPDGWKLEEALMERNQETRQLEPFYSLFYRTPDSTCVYISGSEGLGEPFPTAQPNERTVAVAGVPTDGPVRLGWGVAGEEGVGWEGGLVATEAFATGGHSYVVGTSDDEGCRMASPDDVETLLSTLRALDPALDARLN